MSKLKIASIWERASGATIGGAMGGAGGAALGGIGGAMAAGEGDRMSGALRGAGTGAAVGALGGGAGGAMLGPSIVAHGAQADSLAGALAKLRTAPNSTRTLEASAAANAARQQARDSGHALVGTSALSAAAGGVAGTAAAAPEKTAASRFHQTVAKLAQSAEKVSVLPLVPAILTKKADAKTAGILRTLFGGGVQREGFQDILKGVAAGVGTAALTAGGAKLFDKIEEHYFGSKDQAKATHSEIGKLNAQSQFKAQSIMMLQSKYDTVLAHVMKDEVIGKADKALMRSAYETMKRFAPNLAADENAVRSFLREHAIYGTGPSYAALKNLADAEASVARAGGMAG